ncbi:MAG: Fis family transcriptional regulator, partial [Pseudomonadales bacterium]|nr:Fis family transcriptional regulator [Pseudomonadales bacterium]
GTGLELAEDIHALRPDLPILLTTGNANNLNKSALTSAELAGIFEKPLNSEQLLAKIRGLLAS